MPGSITLPQIVLELEEEDRKRYQELLPPKSMVVRYGYLRLIAELPYDGQDKPGCGSKVVIRTERGTEIAEMLTTTCGNAGCSKSVSRQDMLRYIEESGGRNYPFSTSGRVLRVATPEDLLEQQKLESRKTEAFRFAKQQVREANLPMHLVDMEMLLGGERILFHYTSEQWVDFRELVKVLAGELQTRIEMHQVNARDEARIVADYERCGQHCCCKQFLKVLKPVSMRMAKVQKATLDPAKISGRCGRLMCCLRYEDETYESLRKKLPHKQSRIMTEQGPGTVLDGQILTQLVLVKLDAMEALQAIPVEEIKPLPRDQDPLFNKPPASTNPPGGSESAGTAAARPTYPRRDNPPRPGGASNPPSRPRSVPSEETLDHAPDTASPSQEKGTAPDSPSRGYQRRPAPAQQPHTDKAVEAADSDKKATPLRSSSEESSVNKEDLSDQDDSGSDAPASDFDESHQPMDGDDRSGSSSATPHPPASSSANEGESGKRRRRRRRRRRRGGGSEGGAA